MIKKVVLVLFLILLFLVVGAEVKNAPPKYITPLLGTEDGSYDTNQDLRVVLEGVSDADDDPVRNIYNWFVNRNTLAVLNLPFAGGSNETFTKDYSEPENHGQVRDAVWKPLLGPDGKGAYDFSKETATITIANDPSLDFSPNKPFTVSFWVKFGERCGTKSGPARLVAKGQNGAWQITGQGTWPNCFASFGVGGCGFYDVKSSTLPAGEWRHLAMIYDGSRALVYTNGVLSSKKFCSGGIPLNNNPLVLGDWIPSGNGRPFNGYLADVQIYSRALSAEQVEALFKDQKEVIVSEETKGGEIWSVKVTLNDGKEDGITLSSNEVVIQSEENHPPQHSEPLLELIALPDGLTSELVVTPQNVFDAEGDSLKIIYNWFVDDDSLTVLNLPFIRGSDDAFTKDYSGYGNQGTIYDALWTPLGPQGKGAYDLSEETATITIANDPSLDFSPNKPFTVSFWVKFGERCGTKSGPARLVAKGQNGAWQITGQGTWPNCFASFGVGGCGFYDVKSSILPAGEWRHLAMVYDGGRASAYTNGVLSTKRECGAAIPSTPADLVLGDWIFSGQSRPFKGYLAEVQIYNRALSAEQVGALFEDKKNLIVSPEIKEGEVWSVEVTPNDGKEDGATLLSNKVAIPRGNLIFYESFDNLSSISSNQGTITGSLSFIPGLLNEAADLKGNKKICYPLENNFNLEEGTLEFWVKPPIENGLGFFDLGRLEYPNSWGLFKNKNFAIMEVKNKANGYDQAWSPNSLVYDEKWHLITATWEREGNTTNFKICLDGSCKNDYDGIVSESYPNLTKEFCVGWCYWYEYGYSDSFFDEFKIFDYTKSNEEIYEDYLALADKAGGNKTKKECIMDKSESRGTVKINCSGLYVNDEPFTARGVGYQPIPIGKTAESLVHKREMYGDPRIYRERDFPLLRTMGTNTIRTWGEVMNETFLDAAYNNGENPIYVLMGFWINCKENYGDPAIRQKYLGNFTEYVTKYKDHPAVLAWGIGNENTMGYCSLEAGYVDDFYSLANELAEVAYQIEGEDYHPVGIINGDLGYIGLAGINSDDASLNYVDFWGINVYPGKSFGTWFDEYAFLSGKPLMITEYGIDALNNSNKQEYEDVHSEWIINQWREIDSAEMTIGSALMAYSDEWWKSGSWSTHDYGGYNTERHPDGYSNEEWWGVMRTVKNESGGTDIMEPRQVYRALSEEWS